MPRINLPMLDLLSDLSPEARSCLEIFDTELSAHVARTRMIIEEAKSAKTAIHWLSPRIEAPNNYEDFPSL